ncbi:alcohol dehydrogenase [Actinorhabdospora filicis]|uniref:Alcohol dehydrogenase n=1 Tax=Actinorhabdospora filicis TaxID=1785913 RepID=A0A9W6SSI6_9ACTN|nr:NAD(P)-dependent alcohol dehydrogenase [Actinorhabdospora filicis]GLZ82079.1 alcohol dehydrogenase [Actinorhabdospora filicis]
MRSYHLTALGTVDGYVLREEERPEPGPGQILVRVRAVSFNKRDEMILNGVYPMPSKPDLIPMSDGAGDVVALGEGVTRVAVGDRVIGSYWSRWEDGPLTYDAADQLGCSSDGMLTEYALMDARAAVRFPDSLSYEEAATLPCAAVTAWTSITGGAPIVPGQTLVTLGTGAVSLFALQLGKHLGLRVLITTSRDENAQALRDLGADAVVNYRSEPNWSKAVKEFTGGRGADIVVNTAGPGGAAESMRAAGLYGHIVQLTTTAPGVESVSFPGDAWAQTMATVRRVFVGSRADLEQVVELIAATGMKPQVDKIFTFDELHEAFRYYQSGAAFGKVVVTV